VNFSSTAGLASLVNTQIVTVEFDKVVAPNLTNLRRSSFEPLLHCNRVFYELSSMHEAYTHEHGGEAVRQGYRGKS
jgi:hypothetical protein